MKINQEQTFKPITIVLETKEEAEAFIGIINEYEKATQGAKGNRYKLAAAIANHFSNEVTL